MENSEQMFAQHEALRSKYDNIAPLEMTANDHKAIHSSLDDKQPKDRKMMANPDMPRLDALEEADVLDYLQSADENLRELQVIAKTNPSARRAYPAQLKKFQMDLNYLKKRGRLPAQFENYDINKLESAA